MDLFFIIYSLSLSLSIFYILYKIIDKGEIFFDRFTCEAEATINARMSKKILLTSILFVSFS